MPSFRVGFGNRGVHLSIEEKEMNGESSREGVKEGSDL